MGRHPERFGAYFDKKRARQNRYYQRARERCLAEVRRINYGCDQATYQRLLSSQGGVCAIRHQPETSVRNGRIKFLAVDHDHRTGRIRGLLCERHNTGIGQFRDDVGELRAAIYYLTGAVADEVRGARDLRGRASLGPSPSAVKARREGGQLTILDAPSWWPCHRSFPATRRVSSVN